MEAVTDPVAWNSGTLRHTRGGGIDVAVLEVELAVPVKALDRHLLAAGSSGREG